MDELWIKVALLVGGGLLGFLGGRFNKRLDHRVERKKLRQALYAELGANMQTFMMHLLDLAEEANNGRATRVPHIDGWIRREVYDDALKRSVLFRELKEAKVLDDFYFATAKALEKPKDERRAALRNIAVWFNTTVDDGTVSRRLMYRVTGRFGYNHRPRWRKWVTRRYSKLVSRNLKTKPNEAASWMPPKTLIGHLEAIRTGLPSKEITRFPRDLAGVGPEVVEGVRSAVEWRWRSLRTLRESGGSRVSL
jgi:hypothetical protein